MKATIASLLTAAVAASLAYCYVTFLLWFGFSSSFLPATQLEAYILGTAALLMAVILAVGRLRTASVFIVIDILSIEILALPFLAYASFFTGSPVYDDLIKQILFAWPSAVLLVVPAYGIYRVVSSMREGSGLSTILPSAVALFVFLAVLSSSATVTPSGPGLSGLLATLGSVVLREAALGAASPSVAVTGVLLYTLLLLYATFQGREERTDANPILILAVLGTIAALGWGIATSSLLGFAPIVFGIPGLALVALLWVVSRAR